MDTTRKSTDEVENYLRQLPRKLNVTLDSTQASIKSIF